MNTTVGFAQINRPRRIIGENHRAHPTLDVRWLICGIGDHDPLKSNTNPMPKRITGAQFNYPTRHVLRPRLPRCFMFVIDSLYILAKTAFSEVVYGSQRGLVRLVERVSRRYIGSA